MELVEAFCSSPLLVHEPIYFPCFPNSRGDKASSRACVCDNLQPFDLSATLRHIRNTQVGSLIFPVFYKQRELTCRCLRFSSPQPANWVLLSLASFSFLIFIKIMKARKRATGRKYWMFSSIENLTGPTNGKSASKPMSRYVSSVQQHIIRKISAIKEAFSSGFNLNHLTSLLPIISDFKRVIEVERNSLKIHVKGLQSLSCQSHTPLSQTAQSPFLQSWYQVPFS